jgi:hypothetical protein
MLDISYYTVYNIIIIKVTKILIYKKEKMK